MSEMQPYCPSKYSTVPGKATSLFPHPEAAGRHLLNTKRTTRMLERASHDFCLILWSLIMRKGRKKDSVVLGKTISFFLNPAGATSCYSYAAVPKDSTNSTNSSFKGRSSLVKAERPGDGGTGKILVVMYGMYVYVFYVSVVITVFL